MKQVLLKTIVIVVGKLTRSKVLRGGAGLHGASRSGDGTRNFLRHAGRGRGEDPILQTHLAPLSSLTTRETTIAGVESMMDVIKRVNLDLDFSFYRVYLGLKSCKFQLMYSF